MVSKNKILRKTQLLDTSDGAFVYFLIKNDVIVYVGQSKTLRHRIASHTDKDFDRVQYLKVPQCDQCILELALIKAIKPILNRQKTSAMTDAELDILKEYEFEEDTIATMMRSQPHIVKHQYGHVGYFDDEGNPQVGLYDGEEDYEHEEDCAATQIIEILKDEKMPAVVSEYLWEKCKCEPDFIVMDGFLTYIDSRPSYELFNVDAPEFAPIREKFDKKFHDDFYFKRKEGGNGSKEDSRRDSIHDIERSCRQDTVPHQDD